MSKWIRKGERVLVIAGNDRGKTGEVLSRSEDRVLIQGVNVRKKHLKRTQQTGGRIVEMEAPIHVSNVALCDKEGRRLKVMLKHEKETGARDLVHKTGGRGTVHRSIKKVKHV
ncbi:MAG: 50S ribosomal protein L24 [Chlamydiales bacterium]